MEGPEPSPEAPAAAPPAPVCAAHAGAQASGTCDRCGNFVCPLCLDPDAPLAGHCEACRAREGVGAVPWERREGRWLRRWWSTCAAFVLRPAETLERVQVGFWGASVAFTAVTGAAIGLVFSALGACAFGGAMLLGLAPSALGPGGPSGPSGEEAGAVAGVAAGLVVVYPVGIVLGALAAHGIRALLYHLGVVLAGGRGGLGASVWAVGYLLAIHLALVPLLFVQLIPVLGPILSLVAPLAMEAWLGVQLTRVARRFHGLEGGRATFAGWFPFLLGAVLATSCCAVSSLYVFGVAR